VGFGLTAIGIGIDHGWISRTQGLERVRTTLRTFLDGPQGTEVSGTTGYKGWYYHFLDMETGLRYMPFNSELSSIDTALLLAGVLYAKEYFDAPNDAETEIRAMADAIFARVDWNWMARGTDVLSMGWQPESGFLTATWIGYNEAMLLYILGLGAPDRSAARIGLGTMDERLHLGQLLRPLFCSLCALVRAPVFALLDRLPPYRGRLHEQPRLTYFLNSRNATIAQRSYCIANPLAGSVTRATCGA
jgi:hypothetical protein